MSIKQRLIKRHAASSKVATWKPMRRQAASERAELYKHEADVMIAEVEKAIGSGKIFGVPVYNLYFTDDEQEAINEFLYEEYPSVAAFVDNEIELAASNGDDEWINAAQELGEKYANDAEGFCKAYMDFWKEHGYYGLVDMYITEGQLFEDWKKCVYEEAQSAAERHDTRAASRKRSMRRHAADMYTNAEIDELCNNISDPWDQAPEWFFSAPAKAFRDECERMMAEEFCSFNDLTDAQRKAMRAKDPDWFDEEFYGKDSLKNEFDDSEEDAETRQDFLDDLEYRRSCKSCTRDGEYTGYNMDDMGSAGDIVMPRDYLPELFQQAKEKFLYGKLPRE